MKRILLIVLFSTSLLYAVSIDMTFGIQKKITKDFIHAPLYITLYVYQDVYNFRLYGEYTNELYYARELSFYPMQDYYKVGVLYKLEHITLSLEHQCFHPVTPFGKTSGIDGSYTKFEVKLCSQ